MFFNIEPSVVLQSVSDELEKVSADISQEQFQKIVEAIEDAMPGVVQTIAQGTQEFWRNEARASGSGWGEKYARAVKYRMTGKTEAEIYIDEDAMDKNSNQPNIMFAMMMEKGVKSWSIKDALLASDKAKESADGIKYIVVPFPVSAPRKSSQGTMRSQFGGREMTKEMHKIVKSGGRLKAGSLMVNGENVDVSGLTRYNTRQRHSQYGIFRCVSEKSKGWMYPTIGASPVFPSVVEQLNKQISDVISAFCKEIVREFSG